MLQISQSALQYGFANGPGGQHFSRTMMLSELRLLLAACPPSTPPEGYRQAVVNENVLLKATMANRLKSLQGLRQLYALDLNVLLFRGLRDLWDDDNTAQPLLALLCAVGRDPILRGTAQTVLDLPPGTPLGADDLASITDESFPGRYKPSVLGTSSRNAASSWQQSGHLSGHQNKVRSRAQSRPAALAYALLLGYLCDSRGEALFHTLWCNMLDASTSALHDQAFAASQRGWLEYRHAGDVTEISFQYLLRPLGKETPL